MHQFVCHLGQCGDVRSKLSMFVEFLQKTARSEGKQGLRISGVGLLSQDFPTGALNKPAWALEAQWALLSKEVAPACREDP